jgi:hypothetical protein
MTKRQRRAMTVGLLSAATLLLGPAIAAARIDASHKECLQRGYSVDGGNCTLPDGVVCPVGEFNEGTCGAQYKTAEYCVAQGNYVWDEDKCCDGLVATEEDSGDSTCKERSLLGRLIRRPLFWVVLVAVTITIETQLVRKKLAKSKS